MATFPAPFLLGRSPKIGSPRCVEEWLFVRPWSIRTVTIVNDAATSGMQFDPLLTWQEYSRDAHSMVSPSILQNCKSLNAALRCLEFFFASVGPDCNIPANYQLIYQQTFDDAKSLEDFSFQMGRLGDGRAKGNRRERSSCSSKANTKPNIVRRSIWRFSPSIK